MANIASLQPPKKGERGAGGSNAGRRKGSKNYLSRERVELELRHIAFSDPIALFDRVAKGQRTFKLREIHAMSEEMRRCIASVKVKTENLTAGDGAQDTTVEIKLWDKTKALELCARSLGMLKDRVEISAPEELLSRLDRAKVRARNEP